MRPLYSIVLLLALVALCRPIYGDGILDSIRSLTETNVDPEYIERLSYSDFFGYPCTQLMGRDGAIGCTTTSKGEHGWLYPVLTEDDLNELVANAPLSALVPVVAASLFTPENFDRLEEACHLHGMLVLDGPGPEAGFSPADPNPNKIYGLYPNSTMVWNPVGNSWNFKALPAPVFALSYDTSRSIREYASENLESSSFPKYAVRLTDWMYTHNDADVETCLRRNDCAPLGGRSVWTLMDPMDKNKEVVMITAAMDSNAFFHDLAKGADANMSGAIAVLAAIDALTSVDRTEWTRQPLFMLFEGESWGYAGSKAWVADLIEFNCVEEKSGYCGIPYRADLGFTDVHFDKISSIVEVNQVGHAAVREDGAAKLYAHFDKDAGSVGGILDGITAATEYTSVDVEAAPEDQELPPSSLMSFLLADRSVSGVVLTDHKAEYNNKYFHSQFDKLDLNEVSMQAVCDVASTVARTAYKLAAPDSPVPEDLAADCFLVAQLFDCLTMSYECDLMKQLYVDLQVVGSLKPPSNYVSVYSRGSPKTATRFIHDWIYYTTAVDRPSTECTTYKNCTSSQSCLGGECVGGSQVRYHDALSPAFAYASSSPHYGIVDDSPHLPQWTEAYWQTPYLTLFMMDNPLVPLFMISFGVIEFGASIAVVLLGMKYFRQHLKST